MGVKLRAVIVDDDRIREGLERIINQDRHVEGRRNRERGRRSTPGQRAAADDRASRCVDAGR
jgi:hypothetical protein